LTVLILFLFLCARSIMAQDAAWTTPPTRLFKMKVPSSWSIEKASMVSAFTGNFIGDGIRIFFHCINNQIAFPETELEYLKSERWSFSSPIPCNLGVTYTDKKNIRKTINEQKKSRPRAEWKNIVVKKFPKYSVQTDTVNAAYKQKFPNADYIGKIMYKHDTVIVPIEIPMLTKQHNFKIDTTENFIIKTVWPKNIGDGTTGIYYVYTGPQAFCRCNLTLRGYNLNKMQQQLALRIYENPIVFIDMRSE